MMEYGCMSSEIKFEKHSHPAEKNYNNRSRVKLTDLVSRLNEEKKKERSEEKTKEPLVIKTQHKNINIVNKETVVVEQIILTENKKPKEKPAEELTDNDFFEQKKNNTPKTDLGHNILGIRTPKEDKLHKHLFGQKSVRKTQKTKYYVPDFLNQEMYWNQE